MSAPARDGAPGASSPIPRRTSATSRSASPAAEPRWPRWSRPAATSSGRCRVADLAVRTLGAAPLRRDTLVYSVGFGVADGELRDAKIDICAHCARRAPADWVALLGWWVRRHGLPPFGVDGPLLANAAEVALLGIGLRPDGEMRTNLYLKPPPGRARPLSAAARAR